MWSPSSTRRGWGRRSPRSPSTCPTGTCPLEKVVFSAAEAEGFDLEGRDQALVCGIETHVCVNQTALDLLADGVDVQIAEDAVGSRTDENKRVGLQKMERAGAEITSVETALFELLGRAGTDEFKRVQKLILEYAPNPGARRGDGRGRYVLLEDGTRFDGDLLGSGGEITGEVVFNTSMTGYQEAVTDPSYAGQILTFTYPLIGNYGVSAGAMESDRVHARGVIMREGKNGEDAATAEGGWLDWLRDNGIAAIDGIDTRALVRHIRDGGAMRGGIFPAELAESEARETVAAEPSMEGADFAREVTPPEPVELDGDGPHVVGIDTGIKLSIIRQLRERGCRVTLVPCDTSAEDVLARDPDLVFLANGPGDPSALDYVVENVRGVVGKKPVVGICLGHQLLCRAVGLETFKLPFGHRGANHPVKDLDTGPDRHHLAEPRLRGARPWRRPHDRRRRAGSLADRLRGGRALPPQPLRPHGGGPGAEGRPRLHGPVPPGGRPGPARRPLPLRPVPGAGPHVTGVAVTTSRAVRDWDASSGERTRGGGLQLR